MILKQNNILKVCLLILFFTFSFSSKMTAQLTKDSKIFIFFKDVDKGDNVNEEDAKNMLKDYILGKTTCSVVESKDEANIILQLSVTKGKLGYRKGKISVIDNKTDEIIFESKWKKAGPNAYNQMSGTRGAIGWIVKKPILDKYPEIKKPEID